MFRSSESSLLWGAILNFQWPVRESERNNTKFNTPAPHWHLRPFNTNESHDTGERKWLIGPNWTLRGVLTFVGSGLDINGCVLSYFEGQQIWTVIQAVHSLLYIVAKCHFFSVVTWKYIIKYLQKNVRGVLTSVRLLLCTQTLLFWMRLITINHWSSSTNMYILKCTYPITQMPYKYRAIFLCAKHCFL